MIRPIEMQMLIPNSGTVGNNQHQENQRVLNDNVFAANQIEKEVKQNSEIVIRKDPTEFQEYKYDAKEEGNQTYQDPRKRKRKKKVEEENLEDDTSTNQTGRDDRHQPRVNIQI